MKAIVVEDSRLAREGLIRMLQDFPEIEVVGQADHPSTALQLIEQTMPDVIFLDIHMPGESGFDLLQKLNYTPRIVFTTAYSDYAIRSFDFNTVDYLLKPISQDRLAQAIQKLSGPEEAPSDAPKPVLDYQSKIFVKDGDKCHLIGLDTVQYVESNKNYVQIYFGDQRAYVKKSLNSMEERLPKKYFFRVSRQHIVNLQAIVSIEESLRDGYYVTMKDGKVLEVSRRNATELKDLLSL
jgi:two-component system LytT family response regulator